MTKYNLILILLLSFTFISAQQLPWRPLEKELKITFSNEAEMYRFEQLKLNADIYAGFARVYATPEEIASIEKAGFNYSIEKDDLNEWAMQYNGNMLPAGYYTYDRITEIADSLANAFPDICKKYIFGYNSLGQELAALKISDSAEFDQNEAEVLMDGGIHGDEIGASQYVIQLARDLCLAYGSEPYITGLINEREIWLYYCINPWGRDNMTRYNPNYVDLNRDFSYMWDGAGGSPSPFSQKESRALRDCMNMNQFVSYTNYHSGFEVVSYPWSYRYAAAPDKPHFEQLAIEYSEASGYSNLAYGQGSLIMYIIGGSTKDYTYACNGSVGWSMEISNDKQPEGPNIQMFYQYNKPAMIALIEHSGYGIKGMVTDSLTGQPIGALIFSGDNYPAYSDPAVGDFHKYMIPGTYDVKITASGYKSKTIYSVVVDEASSTLLNVKLQPEPGDYAYRTVGVRIPYINFTAPAEDYYTAAALGKPDNVHFSLGKGGYLRIDMGRPVIDAEGNDLKLFENDGTPEGCTVLAAQSIDGPWIPMGSVTGTTELDLATTSFNQARYFMLQDDNDGQLNDPTAGYELDAIQILSPPAIENATVSGQVTDKDDHQPLGNVRIQIGDSVVFTNSGGYYSAELPGGEYNLLAELDNYLDYSAMLQLVGGELLVYDFQMQITDTIAAFLPKRVIDFKLYPNPFTDRINLEISCLGLEDVIATIYNEAGREVYRSETIPCNSGINHSTLFLNGKSNILLSSGVYLIDLRTEKGYSVKKIIKTY